MQEETLENTEERLHSYIIFACHYYSFVFVVEDNNLAFSVLLSFDPRYPLSNKKIAKKL